MFNNILKMKLKEIKIKLKCVNETHLCTAWLQVICAAIPMKIMFENTPSVHLTVYRGNFSQYSLNAKN